MAPKAKSKGRPTRVAPPQQSQPTTKRKRTDDDTATVTKRPKKNIKQEMKDCDICADTKPVYRDFPKMPTCDHDATVCKDCYQKHFKTRMDENRNLGWGACNCPLCGQTFTKEQARGLLSRAMSREFDKSITKMAEQTADNWIWCPARGCGHGQSHKVTKVPWVKCSNCKSQICFHHQRLWHKGLTCAEFDDMANKDKAAQKDREVIRTTTKACPFCRRRIKKEGGCNHMVCTGCRKEWMWNEVPFDGETVATPAEILGKRGGAVPITGETRQMIQQVMAANNARIDQENAQQEQRSGTIRLLPQLRAFQRAWVDFVARRAPDQLPPVFLPNQERVTANRVPQANQQARPLTEPLHRRAFNNLATTLAAVTNRIRVPLIDLTDEDDEDTDDEVTEWEEQIRGNLAGSSRNNPVDLTSED